MSLANFVKLQVGGGGDLPEFRWSAVDEFRAEFNRHWRLLLSMREDAATDAVTRFKHDDVTSGASQFAGGCETGGASADNDDRLRRQGLATIVKPPLGITNRASRNG